LAELYAVTLGMRQHKVAFTKEMFEFYQCVEVEKAA
jgi:hypothetical protein